LTKAVESSQTRRQQSGSESGGAIFGRQVLRLFRIRDPANQLKGRQGNECSDSYQKRSYNFRDRTVVGHG
jgi:hypothetical protein